MNNNKTLIIEMLIDGEDPDIIIWERLRKFRDEFPGTVKSLKSFSSLVVNGYSSTIKEPIYDCYCSDCEFFDPLVAKKAMEQLEAIEGFKGFIIGQDRHLTFDAINDFPLQVRLASRIS